MSSTWPQHEDGSNKTVGEMTAEERKAVMQAARLRYFARHEKTAKALDEEGSPFVRDFVTGE